MFLVFAGTSIASIPVARLLVRRLEHTSARTSANVLLVFRLLPISLAVAVSLGLALPAFLKFEPPSTHEMLNAQLLSLAVLGGGVLVLMLVRALRVWRMTRFMQQEWQRHSHRASSNGSNIPLFRIDTQASLLAVTGFLKPKVFVSRAVSEALTEEELTAALAHESAHVRSRDNLKQMLMKITAPPAWLNALRSTDAAWTRASEVAADESALAQGASALELSSALIKVGRLSMGNTLPSTLTASHLVPCGCSSATLTRAAHLRDLLENGTVITPVENSGGRKLAAIMLLMVAIYIGCFITLLPAVHEALEFLVQ